MTLFFLFNHLADWTRLELATSAVTGRHSNQLNYQSGISVQKYIILFRFTSTFFKTLLQRLLFHSPHEFSLLLIQPLFSIYLFSTWNWKDRR